MKIITIRFFILLLFTSPSLQAQWIQSSGIPLNQVVFSIVSSNGKLFAGTGTLGSELGALLSSTDNGISWTNVDVNQSNLSAVMSMNTKGNYIYAGTYNNDLLVSSNGGANWIRKAVTNAGAVVQIGISGNNVICYTTGIGPSKISTDNGVSWNDIEPDILKYINSFLTIGNTIYAGAEKGLAYSTNNGLNWTLAANNGIPSDGNGQKLIYSLVYHDGKIFANSAQKIFYTTDNSNNWTATNISLSNFGRVYSMISYNGKIFSSMYGLSDTARGVIFSTNNGSSWSPINQGLSGPPSIRSLFLNNQFLLAGTYQNGIYRIPISAITGLNNQNEFAEVFSLKQNFPNPFNPETKINFTTNKKEFVSLKIYDAMGKLVAELANSEMNAGSYSFTFIGEKLSSGIYFYQLKAGTFSDTKRMMLVK